MEYDQNIYFQFCINTIYLLLEIICMLRELATIYLQTLCTSVEKIDQIAQLVTISIAFPYQVGNLQLHSTHHQLLCLTVSTFCFKFPSSNILFSIRLLRRRITKLRRILWRQQPCEWRWMIRYLQHRTRI